jgi:hypothetical protein
VLGNLVAIIEAVRADSRVRSKGTCAPASLISTAYDFATAHRVNQSPSGCIRKGHRLNHICFPQTRAAQAIFGDEAIRWGRMINDISSALFNEVYYFEAMETFDVASAEHKRRVYWTEMLQRAHLASVASIVRATAWIDAATREYEAGNLYGWAAACRSFIEAAGDTMHSLRRVPFALADHHHAIRANITGKGLEVLTSAELEDDLIHFTHGRKIEKGAASPESHKAKKTWEYVRLVEGMKINGAADLYAELCEIVHPASASVLTMILESGDGWRLRPDRQGDVLKDMAHRNRAILGEVLMPSFNPPLLTLRVLHKFKIFKHIDELKKYKFDNIGDWSRIEAALRS